MTCLGLFFITCVVPILYRKMISLLYLLTTLFLSIYFFIGVAVFLSRRRKFPIHHRRPLLVVASTGSFYCVIMLNLLPATFPSIGDSCILIRVLNPLFLYPAIQFMCLRLYLLLYWDMITQAGLNHFYNRTLLGTATLSQRLYYAIGRFCLMNRSRFSENQLAGITAGISLVFYLVSLIFFFRNFEQVSRASINDEICDLYRNSNRILNGINISIFGAAPVSLAIFAFRNFDDGLLLKAEFNGILISAVIFIVLQIVKSFIEKKLDALNIFTFISIFPPFFIFVSVTLYRVVFWSFKYDSKSSQSDPTSSSRNINLLLNSSNANLIKNFSVHPLESKRHMIVEELRQILENSEGHKLFLNFAEKEFTVESVLFLDSCKEFSTLFPHNNDSQKLIRIREFGKKIFEQFIQDEAVLRVNISSNCKQELERTFMPMNNSSLYSTSITVVAVEISPKKQSQSHSSSSSSGKKSNSIKSVIFGESKKVESSLPQALNQNCFTRAEEEILKLVAHDSFRRFKLHKEFAKWKTSCYDKDKI